ncbi:MAG: ABC transporter substrate-binding protein [Pseudomonadota bacterium]
MIGEASSTFEEGLELAPAAQYVRAATLEGLVALDPAGQVVPAIAERWIVTDDGLSYIFRLRDSNWPDGDPITGEAVRTLLAEAISAQKDTALGFDLAKIRDVRAMTGRVIEIRLTSPMPEFLRLMAQPELGFIKSGSGAGPMVLSRDEDAPLARLSALPPESRGLPAREDWEENANNLTVQAMPATPALEGFSGGEIDLVLNGRLWSFPQVELGPLSRGTIQLDPARGLFGFAFTNDDGLLADPERREALSMAIERSQLVAAFGISGWQSSSWIIPPELFPQLAPAQDRWPELTLEQRQSIAARRIAQWENDSDEPVELLVALPAGPGAVLLYRQLARDWRAIGVTATRVEPGEPADLVVIDRVARYSSPRWFLNQFHCVLENALCSAEADKLVADSLAVSDPLAKERILAEAQSILLEEEVFIPLGAPVRWSLVRGAIDAYEPNIWGLHPLFPLSQPPI